MKKNGFTRKPFFFMLFYPLIAPFSPISLRTPLTEDMISSASERMSDIMPPEEAEESMTDSGADGSEETPEGSFEETTPSLASQEANETSIPARIAPTAGNFSFFMGFTIPSLRKDHTLLSF